MTLTNLDHRIGILQEALLARSLREMSSVFQARSIKHLYFKGTALGYTLYPHAILRPRMDTDLLIDPQQKSAAMQALQELGFTADFNTGEESISLQKAFIKEEGFHTVIIDLHWGISNRPLFQSMLSFQEAWAAAEPAPRLSPHARVFGRIHALVIAIVHPIMHHHGEQDPIWWSDQLRIMKEMTSEEWVEFFRFVRQKKILRIVREALGGLAQHQGWDPPALVQYELLQIPSLEKSWIFQIFNRSLVAQKILDFIYSQNLKQAFHGFFASLFPSPNFMFRRYNIKPSWVTVTWLPFLYAHRAMCGIIFKSRSQGPRPRQ